LTRSNRLAAFFIVTLTATLAVGAQNARPGSASKQADGCVHVQDGSFHSISVDRDEKYRILLPCGYGQVSGRFPVLYLLHGLYGDYLNWDTLTGLEHYAEKYDLIVVMPDADNSWYTNSVSDPKDKFEDYIARDLIAEIDGKFRTIRTGRARAIAGLSMGGYGALKIGLRYPSDFAFAGSISGALNAALDLAERQPAVRDKLLKTFGEPGSATRLANNIFAMIDTAKIDPAHPKDLPYFYLSCGESDDFLEVNRQFAAKLSARGTRYEYHETMGGHAWDYWDRSLPDLLRAVAMALQNQ
jgi:putative tributyrin esterase